MSLVQLERVAIGYRRQALLRGIDLSVAAGETLAVVGPNGAGKSTLLSTMLGVTAPVEGKVTREPGLVVGYVPQRGHHDPMFALTAGEVVAMGGLGTRSWLRLAAAERVHEALGQMGLPGFEKRLFRDLSGGQQQRVLIARALVRSPELLVLDEPSAGMDLPSERDLLELLKSLAAEAKMAIVFVTHQIAFAADYARWIALLNKDQGLFATDRAEALLTDARLTALYGRPMEVLAAHGHKIIRPCAGPVAPENRS